MDDKHNIPLPPRVISLMEKPSSIVEVDYNDITLWTSRLFDLRLTSVLPKYTIQHNKCISSTYVDIDRGTRTYGIMVHWLFSMRFCRYFIIAKNSSGNGETSLSGLPVDGWGTVSFHACRYSLTGTSRCDEKSRSSSAALP